MRQHGQAVTYRFGIEGGSDSTKGCRCEPCRRAVSDYERERRQRIEPAYVGADEVRQHLALLSEHGLGWQTVAKRAGVSNGTVSKILYGDYGRGTKPSKRVRRQTRDRIIAVMPSDAADRNRVDGGRTQENIAILLARGWTKAAIARSISGDPDARTLQVGKGKRVHASTARAIEALLDQPVPPRHSRHGEHPVPQPVDDEETSPPVDLPQPRPIVRSEMRWRRRAACRLPDVPVWIFFPGRGDAETVARAKEVCSTCPVSAECLAAHLDEREGIYGGTSGAERREIRRARRHLKAAS